MWLDVTYVSNSRNFFIIVADKWWRESCQYKCAHTQETHRNDFTEHVTENDPGCLSVPKPCWREALVACSALSICLNRCWLIINYTTRNIFQWNSIYTCNAFIRENSFEHLLCKLPALLCQPQQHQCTIRLLGGNVFTESFMRLVNTTWLVSYPLRNIWGAKVYLNWQTWNHDPNHNTMCRRTACDEFN